MKNKYGILCILLIILFFGGMTQNSQIADAKKITTSSRQKNPPANYSTRYKGWASCKPSYMTIYNGKYATMSYWDVKKPLQWNTLIQSLRVLFHGFARYIYANKRQTCARIVGQKNSR